MRPCIDGGGNIRLPILCVPSKTRAHLEERHTGQLLFDKNFFARRLNAFDELHNTHFLLVSKRAHHHPKRRAGYTLAIARE